MSLKTASRLVGMLQQGAHDAGRSNLEAVFKDILTYHTTPEQAAAIAQRAGISHAYLFRLYGTKKQLFVACCERCFERTLETFTAAANGATPMERLESMGQAYTEMLANRELLLAPHRGRAPLGFDRRRAVRLLRAGHADQRRRLDGLSRPQ